jgi:hypothetical protein
MRAEALAVASYMKILADASWFTRRCELPRIWQKRIFFKLFSVPLFSNPK